MQKVTVESKTDGVRYPAPLPGDEKEVSLAPLLQHGSPRIREAVLIQALRDIMLAVEAAEDNDYSPLSRKLLSATADRASALTYNLPRTGSR